MDPSFYSLRLFNCLEFIITASYCANGGNSHSFVHPYVCTPHCVFPVRRLTILAKLPEKLQDGSSKEEAVCFYQIDLAGSISKAISPSRATLC